MASLDEISRAIGNLEAKVETLTDLVAAQGKDQRVVADKVRNWEQRAIGMSLLSGILGAEALSRLKGWF